MKRFKYAFQGLLVLFNKDKKFLIHIIFACFAILLSFYLKINIVEWFLIIIAIGFVLTFEAMNTALEYVVDLITDEYHELAKKAKDTAAASVMLASIIALVIGLIVFLPYFIK
ncbi:MULTISPECIES: diacylglycerol kinase family protein [Staphylococcus]|uniref:diacylglycerol kinase family protein n=1 Tax=Staphylococcus TaxID=1279 RepID=UPI00085C6854|nr:MULTISPECIES: diacylglycerol kinase family protein [Staphylococcus]PTG48640.1 diacylglycerol kinase family protein [Staphylococcus cohnii]SCT26684.1 diacylglycerol kinase [Staphylococcus cohnii subsp. cohnii]MDQ7110527.1 diacylglycerol kinase family protein [Staphylococcus ureilyticus]MDU9349849.1 diacylglycerol kinase family protein [Staphylococcus ureilyticus]OHO40957.1 diacylglycerol kinase [Staphylococcus sp. HMSC034G07]